MTELTIAQTMAIDKIHATIAERDRLKAINAELVEALEGVTDRFEAELGHLQPHGSRADGQAIDEARILLAKARKEG